MDQILRGLCLAVRAELLSGLHLTLLASVMPFIHCKAQEAQDRAGLHSSLLDESRRAKQLTEEMVLLSVT